ncbi:transglycosylase domain-containing protein [Propionibacteriaceae bacterium G57]|uniref:transglycosylase domain-containing protein n=1 Tax=Aestuariimicrobium sp. G57 TaxID=3418485 RepID=UPI003DA6FEF5
MKRTKANKVYALLMFFAVSVLAGVLTAGLAVPFVAMLGGVSKAGADSLDQLPASLEIPPQSEQSRILMADGSVLATFYDQNRVYVGLRSIHNNMQWAQLAIEDHRFYEHGAFDPTGTIRALVRNSAGASTQGGSTITQQYVKQVLVNDAEQNNDPAALQRATEETLARKVRELRYAIALEKRLSKQEILERYLNIAYYGDGAYGVEAAARHFFNTTAAKLTLDQAAMLAGLVQNPNLTNPRLNPGAAVARRNVVLNRMADLGYVSQEQADKAKEVKWNPSNVQPQPNGCAASEFPFICDYVRRVMVSDAMPSLGKTEEERWNLIKRGGLTIQTLIDPRTQRAAEAAINDMITPTDPAIGSSVIIEPQTGLIVAMAQSRTEMGTKAGQTFLNYNVEKKYGDGMGFQAGSTFKAFAVAAAIEAGMTPDQSFTATSPMSFEGKTFKNCEGSFTLNEDWTVSNSVGGYDNRRINMIQGAQGSVNTYFVQLEQAVGICKVTDIAQRAGVKLASGADLNKDQGSNPSFVLGAAEVTPLSLASAYATFANRGVRCDPLILKSVVNKQDKSFAVPPSKCTKVMEPEVADGVNYVLSKVMERPGTGVRARIEGSWNQAGKTGTTDSNEAVWFAGYTPERAGIAMIAVDKGNAYWNGRTKSLKRWTTPSGTSLEGSGSGDAGRIYKVAMAEALKGQPNTAFTAPSTRVLEGKKVQVPDTSGMSLAEARRTLEAAGFNTVTWRRASNFPAGTFLGTSPKGSQPMGATIYLMISSGPEPAPQPSSPATKPASPTSPTTQATQPSTQPTKPGNGTPGPKR